MHEVSIMEGAVRMAVDAAKSAGANRVLALRLRVGTLSGVVPEALRFAFDVVCRDTIAEGASLELDDRFPPPPGARHAARNLNARISSTNVPAATIPMASCGAGANWKSPRWKWNEQTV